MCTWIDSVPNGRSRKRLRSRDFAEIAGFSKLSFVNIAKSDLNAVT